MLMNSNISREYSKGTTLDRHLTPPAFPLYPPTSIHRYAVEVELDKNLNNEKDRINGHERERE